MTYAIGRHARMTLRLIRGIAWIALLGLGVIIASRATGFSVLPKPEPPRVSHDLVVQQLQDVAKLVSTEMTLRDVVVYEATRYGFAKRALLVVTGKVSAGIDLRTATDVRIDQAAHRITITLPRARVTSVEVLDVRTYDENAGIFNPFTSDDRDAIQRQVRHKLYEAGEQSGLLVHADSSAAAVLKTLLSRDGYVVDIVRTAALLPASG
ncbi:MAG TPA: DUF4230 domain-containing protein [Gemmatimonadaceae bacterium]|nr:DUF4230 domain-containing protein [Gemmatimonadaceae bacterium]